MMKLVIRNVETKISRIRYTLEKMVERDHPYAQKMKEYGVKPEHIKTARDMQLLPYTTKQDLQEHYPLGWLNVDRKHVVRFHATSGTTGNPTVVCYTQNDIKMWSLVPWARRARRVGHPPGLLRIWTLHRRTGNALRR